MKLSQAAKILNRHPKTLKRWIVAGKLVGVKYGRDWEIPDEEVERIKKEGLQGE